jgi:hypothetical protein
VSTQRLLVVAGILLLLAGIAWPWLSRIPFGRLPGDINVVRDGMRLHLPMMTCLIVSLVLSLLFWIFRQ